jgi:hypothetical protein
MRSERQIAADARRINPPSADAFGIDNTALCEMSADAADYLQ